MGDAAQSGHGYAGHTGGADSIEPDDAAPDRLVSVQVDIVVVGGTGYLLDPDTSTVAAGARACKREPRVGWWNSK